MPSDESFIFNQQLRSALRAAFMTTMTDAAYRNEKNHEHFVHKICKQQLLTVNTVFYFPKNFFLVDEINQKTSAFVTTGIMDFWISQNLQMRFYKISTVEAGIKTLSMDHLLGCFYLLLICLFAAVLVFMCELLRFKIVKSLPHL